MNRRKKTCCVAWSKVVSSIEVNPRDTYNPSEQYAGKALQKLLVYMMGQYCPTCGTKL